MHDLIEMEYICSLYDHTIDSCYKCKYLFECAEFTIINAHKRILVFPTPTYIVYAEGE